MLKTIKAKEIYKWAILLLCCSLFFGIVVFYRDLRSAITAHKNAQDIIARQENEIKELREDFNTAVRKTAITELLVENDKVWVVIRTIKGEIERIETPFNPKDEIYVDFVLIDGKIWIRRVFDSLTPPERAVVINPALGFINWDDNSGGYGKAVYRKLGEGRWQITVSGTGALELTRIKETVEPFLQTSPKIHNFSELN